MFRMLKLDPPNGWRAVAWDLAIVTLGVLIALGAQQWAEGRAWKAKTRHATAAIREELAGHHHWSVEWRVVYPCIAAQIDRLEQRVLASGDRLDPAPIYRESDLLDQFVLRLPSKDYVRSAWEAAISDGVTSHFDRNQRAELAAHYAQLHSVVPLTARNDEDHQALLSLGHRLPLDPSVRYGIVRTLAEMRGRAAFIDIQSGQLIEHIQKLGMVPRAAVTRAEVERFGTYRFCRAQRLPMRSFADAMTAVPN